MPFNTRRKEKATRPDKISAEELEALDEFGVKAAAKLMNDVCNTGHICPMNYSNPL